MRIKQLELIESGQVLGVVWGGGRSARYHAIWLRDNALDADSLDPGNGQRLISILDLPVEVVIESATVNQRSDLELLMMPEGKHLTFTGSWLWQHRYDVQRQLQAGWVDPRIRLWEGELPPDVPTADFIDISNSRFELGKWLANVRDFGFARLRNIPHAAGAVCDVAELFGFVRETNYGRYFEVRSEVDPVNLAYTGLGLQAHTDNPYRDPVPTLQLLACLENSAQGGDSILVDGFNAVRRLKEQSTRDFELLSRYCARFTFAGADDVSLHATRPMIELGVDGRLQSIRFNNRSVAPITDVPFEQLGGYYRAYRHFAEIITDPSMEVTFKLQAGELFIVDNQRVLHSRKSFSSAGNRLLQGCYADIDGLYSTLRVIEGERSTQ